jgi:hypothetical protein
VRPWRSRKGLAVQVDAIDKALKLAEVLLSTTAIGGGLAITAAVLEGKPSQEIERWGFWGTALGCVCGVFLTLCAGVLLGRA